MSDGSGQHVDGASGARSIRTLAVMAILSICFYGLIAVLSWRFGFDSIPAQRPIVPVLLLFAGAFVAYLIAIREVRLAPRDRRTTGMIIWAAIVFRVVMLFSVPIQEIDIYRYLWDGAASTAGVSPFRYSPGQVRDARAFETNDAPLQTLVEMRDRHPSLGLILSRVHYGELPTVYPPVSQLVFAAAAFTTPNDAPVPVHVFVMKLWLVGFDLATLFVVIGLLKMCRQPLGLCVIYAWCPLLIKEVANSGHLDAIAVFLTTLAIYMAAGAMMKCVRERNSAGGAIGLATLAPMTLSAVTLGLAVGAKLYPIVLAPLLILSFARHLGWRRAIVPAAALAATTLLLLWPMMPRETIHSTEADVGIGGVSPPPPLSETPVTETSVKGTTDPSLGVKAFLSHWEMNDFIFLVLVENLRPSDHVPPGRKAWFVVLPETLRRDVAERISARFGIAAREAPFLTTRAITAATFIVVALLIAWRASRTTGTARFCEAGFLTVAWFWLLCPTQNPWYWTWALPLLPFARGRVWLALSGLVLMYYLRFWFSYHWPDTPVWGTGYVGAAFFDFVVTWIEFAPWFLCLAIAFAFRRTRS